ncbi:antibiotic biosynthesis monooxygenase family protein [Streptomyces malaysiensis]|uniref:antibiotic biosynthesis monooxygenase family protein n=1 Tax=Streptomyces malaysiensis TaxID=92644 RepID=UPI00371374CA
MCAGHAPATPRASRGRSRRACGCQPATLVNTFVVPDGQLDKAIDVWRQDSLIMKAQPGFVFAQLHRGIGDAHVLTNMAVWESLTALKDAFMNEEFQNTLPL